MENREKERKKSHGEKEREREVLGVQFEDMSILFSAVELPFRYF